MKMNTNDFQKQLEEWEIEVPDDPHFRASVWREISIRERTSPLNWLRKSVDRLVSPRLAVPLAIGAVFMVLAAASLHGVQSRDRTWEKLGYAYSSAIDPVAHTENRLAKER